MDFLEQRVRCDIISSSATHGLVWVDDDDDDVDAEVFLCLTFHGHSFTVRSLGVGMVGGVCCCCLMKIVDGSG